MTGVLVVGDVIDDVIIQPAGPTAVDSDTAARITSVPGGSGANQAAWLASLGVPVRLAARVGRADADDQRRRLAAAGVDARLTPDPDLPTGSIAVLVGPGGTRSMYTDRGANARLGRPGDLGLDLLAGLGHLHVSGYALIEPASRSAVAALWQEAARGGITRSVDVGSAAFLAEAGPAFLAWTAGAGVIFANLAEGRLVTGVGVAATRDEVLSRLLDHYPAAVLKLGSEGAIVASRSEVVVLPPPDGAWVDPTGAGDAFCAGFLARWLAGASLAEAGAAATASAAAAIERVGGRPRIPFPAAAPPWEKLRGAAQSAATTAYAPYSNLRVGAAGITDGGQIVTGCNVENASFGVTLCAECGLVSALRSAGDDRLVAVSVVAQDGEPLAPCGRCRQLLQENGGRDLLLDRGPDADPVRLGDLLPGSFGPDDLAARAEPRPT